MDIHTRDTLRQSRRCRWLEAYLHYAFIENVRQSAGEPAWQLFNSALDWYAGFLLNGQTRRRWRAWEAIQTLFSTTLKGK